jgi:hypothetical protein
MPKVNAYALRDLREDGVAEGTERAPLRGVVGNLQGNPAGRSLGITGVHGRDPCVEQRHQSASYADGRVKELGWRRIESPSMRP